MKRLLKRNINKRVRILGGLRKGQTGVLTSYRGKISAWVRFTNIEDRYIGTYPIKLKFLVIEKGV